MEPQYKAYQKKSRAIIPKTIILIILGAILYLGLLINLTLLKFSAEQEEIVRISSLVAIIFLIVLGIFLSALRSKRPYLFWQDKITFGKDEIFYQNIENTTSKRNIWDKIFSTYKIKLNNKFSIKHISMDVQLEKYLNQLKQYVSR